MEQWLEYFDTYGKELLKALPVKELEQWYGVTFTYWYTHNYSYGKVGA